MKKNYLINLATHINSDEKRDVVIDTIKHFNSFGVDVCVSLHSTDYLSEISKFSRFVYFDSDNTFLEESDFINNSDLISDGYNKFGITPSYSYQNFGNVYDNFLKSPHSKSVLSVFKNGLSVGFHQGYDWVVYLEYDLPIPSKGFPKLIEEKIELLENEKKDAFFYRVSDLHQGNIYSGLIITKSNIISRSKLLCEDWFLSSRNWIKHWHCSYFEKIIEGILVSDGRFKCIEHNIDNDCLADWGVARDEKFNRLPHVTATIKESDRFTSHLYPYKIKDSDLFGLCLFSINNTDNTVDFFGIKIYVDNILIYERDKMTLNGQCWEYLIVDLSAATIYSKIKFQYSSIYKEKIKNHEEFFLYRNIENIHNNLMNVVFI